MSLADQYAGARGVLPFEEKSQVAAVIGQITASGQTVAADVSVFNGAAIAFWGTFAGITLNFEASYNGGTDWVACAGVSVAGSNPIAAVGSLSAPGAWEVYVPGATRVRVRSSAYTSGTMNVKIVPVAMMQDVSPAVGGGTIGISGNPVLGAGASAIGDVGGAVRAATGGMANVKRLLSAAATTNADFAKASAGRLYKIRGYNAKASVCFLKLYNKASAPTVGTDVPVATIPLAALKEFDVDFGAIGMYFATGIAFAITGAVADADTTALVAADIVGLNMWYA